MAQKNLEGKNVVETVGDLIEKLKEIDQNLPIFTVIQPEDCYDAPYRRLKTKEVVVRDVRDLETDEEKPACLIGVFN